MAIYQPNDRTTVSVEIQPVHFKTDLMTFAEEASRTHKIAQALASTSFVPKQMQGRPDEVTAAILFGREIGMDPMTALQTVNVIQGRPTLTANAMRGLAMASGVQFRLDETTETRCVMSAKAPGQTDWTTITWTIDQARKLGLTSKENWKNQPGAMLIARATSQLCRLVAANVLIGLPYSTEEMTDVDAPQPEEKKTRKVSRATVRAVVGEEPPLEPEPMPEIEYRQPDQPAIEAGYSLDDPEKRTNPEAAVERPDGILPKTRAAIMARFKDLGVTERDHRLRLVGDVVQREIHSVNQLTEGEARRVVAALNDQGWPEAVEVPQ